MGIPYSTIIHSSSATVTNLQAKVEGLTTTNALMKEDLSISRKSVEKIQAENRKLKNELEKFRKIEKKSESSQDIQKQSQQEDKKRTSVVQTSYDSGIKELSQEFRVRLQEELTQREEVEKQLEKQVMLIHFQLTMSVIFIFLFFDLHNKTVSELVENTNGAEYSTSGGGC